jgi:hypothetical protein
MSFQRVCSSFSHVLPLLPQYPLYCHNNIRHRYTRMHSKVLLRRSLHPTVRDVMYVDGDKIGGGSGI